MRSLLPNPYLLAFGVSLLSYLLILGLKFLLSTKISRFTGKVKNKWDDIVVYTIEKTTQFFMVTSAFYLGFNFVPHNKKLTFYVDKVFFIILMWQISIWSYHLMEMWIQATLARKTRSNPALANSISLLKLLGRLVLISILFLFTLSNLGIKITTIIAGLGVGGIAVALALQKILGDLFSSLSIVLDKPFMVGDFIIIDTYLGEVQKIGLKTTRLKSLTGEQLIFSNSDLLGARIRNYKRMQERRIVFNLFLPHQTENTKLQTAVSLISAIIRSKEMIRFDRCHFFRISPASHDLEAVYWVLSDDYNIYMDLHQEILFEIKRSFEEEDIQFAFPTQTIQILPTEISVKTNSFPAPEQTKPLDSIIS
jgi:small-conductance mechanosensitive channel